MKVCNLCEQEKDGSDFYKGHAKCKKCYIEKVKKHRQENIEHYRAYDRERGNRHPKGYIKKYRRSYPNKYKATNMVNNAIRDGRLLRQPCEVCGTDERIHAHHDDYLEPLNVRWLCAAHHSQWHKKHGEAKNP